MGPAQGEGVGGVLATRIGDLDLECCVYNASGPRTGSHQALQKVRACHLRRARARWRRRHCGGSAARPGEEGGSRREQAGCCPPYPRCGSAAAS